MIAAFLLLVGACSTFEAEYECEVGEEVEVAWTAVPTGLPAAEVPDDDQILVLSPDEFRANWSSPDDPFPDTVEEGWEVLIQAQMGVGAADTGGLTDPIAVEDFRNSPAGDKVFARMMARSAQDCRQRFGHEGWRAWLVHSTLPAEPCWKCKTK